MTGSPKVTKASELVTVLESIGMLKNGLPFRLRGWVNSTGLYVRFRTIGEWSRLQAGGKFRSYFDAMGRMPFYDADDDWKIRRFDQETWQRRFAHLVYPTLEIVLFVSGSPFKPTGSQFDENSAIALQQW
ncbi:hypothetical protein ES706_04045 [subsurface metagenome]